MKERYLDGPVDLTGQNTIFRNAVGFKDKLYFCGAVNTIPCIYQVDPKTDGCKQVYAGMTLEEYKAAYQKGVSVGIRGMCVYEDRLIVSCINTDGAVILVGILAAAAAAAVILVIYRNKIKS